MKKLEGLGRVLNREQQKKINGGLVNSQSCSMTYQNSCGQWITENGTCNRELIQIGSLYFPGAYYCQTQSFSGPVPLSSNGGTSKCASAA